MAVVLRFGGQRLRFGGNNLMWSGYIPSSSEVKAVIEYAMDMGYKLPTLPYLLKLDQFIQDVKERGLWDKFDVLYAMRGDVGECAEFRCINLVNPDLSGTPVGGLIFTDLGVEGNAVDGYIETNFNHSIDSIKQTADLAGRHWYNYKLSGSGTPIVSHDAVSGATYNLLSNRNGYGAQRIFSAGSQSPPPSLGGMGFKSANRLDNVNHQFIRNDEPVQNTTNYSTSGRTLSDVTHKILREDSAEALSMYSLGTALNFEESQLLRQAILKYIP